ncbi:threonine synthase, partial [Streptococcus suis]
VSVKNRTFRVTTRPSMASVVSSQLERLIVHLFGNDAAKTAELREALNTTWQYDIQGADEDILSLFAAAFATDDETAAEIK